MTDNSPIYIDDKLQRLKFLQFQFGKIFLEEKINLLNYFIQTTPQKVSQFTKLHQALKTLMAYPDSKEIVDLLNAVIDSVSQKIKGNNTLVNKLNGSGIFNTKSIECNFSYEMTKFLVNKFPGYCKIFSSTIDSENLKSVFKILLPSVEFASIHNGHLDLKTRISLFNKNSKLTDLEWLLKIIDNNINDEKSKELIYNQFEIYTKVKISKREYSAGFLNCHFLPVYFQKYPLDKNFNFHRLIKIKLPAPVELSAAAKSELIDISKLTMFHLCSETEPFTNANVDDITLFELGHGISIALFGSKIHKRYSLESYIGYLTLKNNVPVAYGGGWIFGERCQFGINILEPYRGGESQKFFSELLRVYHQYFGITKFVIKPYQFGLNNPEGLKAGAFWFYYKCGFRPEKNTIRELAFAEEKKNFSKNYKSDLSTLKKFTRSNLELFISDSIKNKTDPETISLEITSFINRKFNSDRDLAINKCFSILKKSLSLKSNSLNKVDLDYAKNVSLLICLLPDCEIWIKKNKRNIMKFILLKSEKTEYPWIKYLQNFESFWGKINDQKLFQ